MNVIAISSSIEMPSHGVQDCINSGPGSFQQAGIYKLRK
jgi:hypothetical protein